MGPLRLAVFSRDKPVLEIDRNNTFRECSHRSLFSVHRNRQDLLPFYARFVATLHPLIPDIATDLGQYLKQEFRGQCYKTFYARNLCIFIISHSVYPR